MFLTGCYGIFRGVVLLFGGHIALSPLFVLNTVGYVDYTCVTASAVN